MGEIDFLDGNLVELAICEPGYLYAGRITNPATGTSWRHVYRSPVVTPGSRMHQKLMVWLDGAEPIGELEITEDEDMMLGEAELSLWEA